MSKNNQIEEEEQSAEETDNIIEVTYNFNISHKDVFEEHKRIERIYNDLLNKASGLREIIIFNANIPGDILKKLCEDVFTLPNVKILNLLNCRSDNIAPLVNLLQTNTNLTAVNMGESRKDVDKLISQDIFTKIKVSSSIKFLNHIDDNVGLGELLKLNPHLLAAQLNHASSIKTFCQVLQSNPSLLKLEIRAFASPNDATELQTPLK